jgi:REP element-mobilizing transposase RayT
MSYRQTYYHIIFCAKHRQPVVPDAHCELLYKYIWGIVKNKKCVLYRVNGAQEHIHLLIDIHPNLALAAFVKDLKVATSLWMKTQPEFNLFEAWAEGYAAFTISFSDRNAVREYIKNQKEHHKTVEFEEEYKALLKENGIEYDEAKGWG